MIWYGNILWHEISQHGLIGACCLSFFTTLILHSYLKGSSNQINWGSAYWPHFEFGSPFWIQESKKQEVRKKFYSFSLHIVILAMPSTRKKSPATEGKRKTRASDKVRSSMKKASSKKKSVSVENDGSYLRSQASHSVPVSTLATSEQTSISVSTGQAILTMISQIDASNKELSNSLTI